MFSIENQRLALESLPAAAGDPPADLSIPMLFGLGAGLSFEYVQLPHESPSRVIVGFNRTIGRNLASRVGRYQRGDRRQAVVEALNENALLFNLDRSPTTALMGIEMLAEQLPDFEAVADWRACLAGMRKEIVLSGSLYRRAYLRFLQEVVEELDTAQFCQSMSEIAKEWDELAVHLAGALADPSHLERGARALRRLAFREEHFWGMILEETQHMFPDER